MGLDMYLSATLYCSGGYDHSSPEEKSKFNSVLAAIGFDRAKAERSLDIRVGVGYWRKANAIHQWFVDHCQEGEDNCQKSYVSRDQLTELKETCQKVLDSVVTKKEKVSVGKRWSKEKGEETIYEDGEVITNPEVAQDLLPTQGGFFFGSTSYDNFYLQDIKDTIAICDKALSLPEEYDFEYRASW